MSSMGGRIQKGEGCHLKGFMLVNKVRFGSGNGCEQMPSSINRSIIQDDLYAPPACDSQLTPHNHTTTPPHDHNHVKTGGG